MNQRGFHSSGIRNRDTSFYGTVMNYARRWNRRAASTKARRKAVKDQIRRGLMAERLEDRTLMAADLGSLLASYQSAYWNTNKPTDVNADGFVAPSDALAVINMLNSVGSHQLPQGGAGEGETGPKMYVDVNNDGYVSAADALAVINQLNGEGAPGAVTVGNFVWFDANFNGLQDAGETGISGVTLTLNGTATTGGATVVDHATTDANGAYLFSEAPGTYTVTV